MSTKQTAICQFTKKAKELIERIHENYNHQLIMVISNGCCDCTAPHLYDNYIVSPQTVKLWEDEVIALFVSDHVVLMSPENGRYVIDVEEQVINDSFSLESDWNSRFVLRFEQNYS